MASDFYKNQTDEGDFSKFNEAALKMIRFHKIQDTLNILRLNPLAYDSFYLSYNYESIFSLLKSLRMEILGKLSETEKTNLKTIKEEIEKILKDNSPYQKRKHYDNVRVQFVEEAWIELQKKLEEFEDKLRILMDLHKFGSPNEESEGGWD